MALIDKLVTTATEAIKVARSAGQQVQSTAAPAVKQTARLVRSQLDQRLGKPPGPRPSGSTPQAAPAVADAPAAPEARARVKAEAPAAPTPAKVAKNIAPERAKPAPKKKPAARKSAPGAKLPVKRPPAKPDPA